MTLLGERRGKTKLSCDIFFNFESHIFVFGTVCVTLNLLYHRKNKNVTSHGEGLRINVTKCHITGREGLKFFSKCHVLFKWPLICLSLFWTPNEILHLRARRYRTKKYLIKLLQSDRICNWWSLLPNLFSWERNNLTE